LRPLLGGDRDGPRSGGLPCEMRAVGFGARDCDKKKSRFDFSAVGGESRDGDRSLPRLDRRIRQKIAQPHRVSFALTNSN
jgi:hypothetical protein